MVQILHEGLLRTSIERMCLLRESLEILETALLLKARGPTSLSSTPYTQGFNDNNIYFNYYFTFLNGVLAHGSLKLSALATIITLLLFLLYYLKLKQRNSHNNSMYKKSIVNNKQPVLHCFYFAMHNLHHASVSLHICQSQAQFFRFYSFSG